MSRVILGGFHLSDGPLFQQEESRGCSRRKSAEVLPIFVGLARLERRKAPQGITSPPCRPERGRGGSFLPSRGERIAWVTLAGDLIHHRGVFGNCGEHIANTGFKNVADQNIHQIRFELWMLAEKIAKTKVPGVEGIHELAKVIHALAVNGVPCAEPFAGHIIGG